LKSNFQVEISGYEVNIALIIFAIAYIYYMMLHMFAGFITASVSLIVHFYYVLPLIQKDDEATFSHLLAVHIFGWIAQFVGHGVFEGRKPALMDNLLQGKPPDRYSL
jgi:uncharacterized membrane protein YGL010W